jgi:hypothetical protein
MSPLTLDYPPLLSQKLEADRRIRAAIDTSLNVVSDILQVSKLPFFPDYTDHGPRHLAAVLEIAEKLISTSGHVAFTPEDAGVLIFAVLLHDLALHISESGFKSLLNSTKSKHRLVGRNWAESWNEFLAVAKHWDDSHLISLFGVDESGRQVEPVKDPFEHYENLTERDRKLIGEFIRQNHAELAYQFALEGFPGSDGQHIQFGSFNQEHRRLAGAVARSHGFPLRDAIRLLEEEQFSRLEQDGTHPAFLMGILRVADFLELGADRAPLVAFAYKEFKSPVSRREWRTNQSFRKISWGNPDPESIHLPARPADVLSYLELRRWLAAIQGELDTTWAILGEVYGSHPRLSCLGLSIRRVRSNIVDDPEGFARSASFVPRRIELGVAGAEVLKLFIEPLYGRCPEIGIRELIQNSVDAVRERWEFERNHSLVGSSQASARGADVTVWLDDPDENGVAMLTVSDNGIGMTEEIIADYFLKAGASLRCSMAWKREFEAEDESVVVPKTKSRVLRSGRFGIGVLASFLLGDQIEVSTRHVTSTRGLRFKVRLEAAPPSLSADPIELSYDDALDVGTTIRIRTNRVEQPKVIKSKRSTIYLENHIFNTESLWDWYCLDSPRVIRLRGPEKNPLAQRRMVPHENSVLPFGWHSLPSSDFRAVHMLDGTGAGTFRHALVCNGIEIRGGRENVLSPVPYPLKFGESVFPPQAFFQLRIPEFSVFDPDGNLPLNLQRTGLTRGTLDFFPAAFEAQSKAAIANFLITAPTTPAFPEGFRKMLGDFFKFEQLFPVFFTEAGTALLTPENLRIADVKSCLIVSLKAFESGWLSHLQNRYDAVLVAKTGSHSTSVSYALNELDSYISSARAITTSGKEPQCKRRFRYKEACISGLQLHRTANCPPGLLEAVDLEIVAKNREIPIRESLIVSDDFIAAELFLKLNKLLSSNGASQSVGRYWEAIIREPVVPFGRSERKAKLCNAFDVFREYLGASPGCEGDEGSPS